MKMDLTTYKLTDKNYIKERTDKTQIVIGNTFNSGMNHYIGWITRLNGTYKNTAMFTVLKNGNIYQHFDSDFYSNVFNDDNLNKKIISIVLENEGWLVKKMLGEYVNVNGISFYLHNVFERRWRGKEFWGEYTKIQMDSLITLIKQLTEKHDIYLRTVGHNTRVDDISEYNGVAFKSNYSNIYTDVSPAFDFEYLNNGIQ